MNERLAAARENSSVGHGAQGTKPLTWQQRERTEESADAPTSIYAARRGALGGERVDVSACAPHDRQGSPDEAWPRGAVDKINVPHGARHRYTETVRRQTRAQCQRLARSAGPWSFALGDSTCENSLHTSIHNVGAD